MRAWVWSWIIIPSGQRRWSWYPRCLLEKSSLAPYTTSRRVMSPLINKIKNSPACFQRRRRRSWPQSPGKETERKERRKVWRCHEVHAVENIFHVFIINILLCLCGSRSTFRSIEASDEFAFSLDELGMWGELLLLFWYWNTLLLFIYYDDLSGSFLLLITWNPWM